MLNPNTPDTQILHRVNLPMLEKAYNAEDGVEGGNTTVLCETPTSFIVENIIPVRPHDNIAFVDNPPRRSYIRYELPKSIFFCVPSADQIPKLVDFRIHCQELDEALGFSNMDAKFYYLFGQDTKVDCSKNVRNLQDRHRFSLCDPLDANDILVIATANQWQARPSIGDWFCKTQTLVDKVCKQHIGGRADPYRGDFEYYGTTCFRLPCFTFLTEPGSPEYDTYRAITERRIQHLRQTCHEIWVNQLFQLEQKANSLDNYIAALRARAAEFEAHARSLREEAAQYEKQLQRRTAQTA